MRPTLRLVSILAPVLVLAPMVLAADEAGGGLKGQILPPVQQGLPTMLGSFITFLIVLGILGATVWPKITKALSERSEKILSEIKAAEVARAQAKDALDSYQKSLAEARAEAQRMLEKTKAQQQALADELRGKADRELAMMKDRARRDIEAAKRQALSDVYSEASGLATRVASKILHREVNADDSRRLLEESMAELTAGRN